MIIRHPHSQMLQALLRLLPRKPPPHSVALNLPPNKSSHPLKPRLFNNTQTHDQLAVHSPSPSAAAASRLPTRWYLLAASSIWK